MTAAFLVFLQPTRSTLHTRLAVLAHRYCSSRRRAGLDVVDLTVPCVRDVPIIRRRIARNARTALHVLAVDLAVAADIRADRTARYCAPGRCDIAAAAAADLVAQHPADHRAGDRAADVRRATPFDFLPLDPAALPGLP